MQDINRTRHEPQRSRQLESEGVTAEYAAVTPQQAAPTSPEVGLFSSLGLTRCYPRPRAT